MAFWGVEVKPGKPQALDCDVLNGKLVLTQATLGISSSTKKTSLQCTIGDNSPIMLCTLLPDKLECCQLNLEFEEEEEVVFSVVGPTSIHLAGFIHQYEDPEHDDDCDSCGEDIDETESEESDFDLEEEEDDESDFIDDDDMNAYPSSRVPNHGVVIEEIEDDEKAATENGGNKQQKKKNQLLAITNNASVLESEDEDGFPVSSSQKKKNDAKDDAEGARSVKRKIDAIDQNESKRVDGQKDSARASDENMNKKKKKKGKAQEIDAATPDENVQKINADGDAADVVSEDVSEKKKKKKKKKAAKTENGEAVAKTEQDASVEAKKTATANKEAKPPKAKPAKVRTFANGLVIEELEMGKPDGKRASRGSKVGVRYIGKLQKTGKIFDSNIGQAPFKFRLGIGQVIKGWDVGVEGMRVGDKRRLTIPPKMGYGSSGAPPQIPPNAWLVFDVELVNVA